jgi:ArsR family transcriptional regulator
VTRAPLRARDAVTLASRLKVLAHPARLRLLSLVAAHPRGEACVCNLVPPSRLSQPTVTHHLQALHRAGFLAREKRGVWVWYRLVPASLASVTASLR